MSSGQSRNKFLARTRTSLSTITSTITNTGRLPKVPFNYLSRSPFATAPVAVGANLKSESRKVIPVSAHLTDKSTRRVNSRSASTTLTQTLTHRNKIMSAAPSPHSHDATSGSAHEHGHGQAPAQGRDQGSLVEIKEGVVRMLYDAKEAVFYNKVQVFNRDLSIQVIQLYATIRKAEWEAQHAKKSRSSSSRSGNQDPSHVQPDDHFKGIKILDALAATGLRSVRYLKEIAHVQHVTINDILPAATEAALHNCRLNDVDESKVVISTNDATMLMYQNRDPANQFDVIDLDPYGSAAPFLDSAVQAVKDGGLLAVTCTDMPVLGGNYPEVCFAKYGSVPLKARYVHEMSLRILLHAIDACANRYRRHIVPWVSVSVDFYVRVFVRVFESPAEVKKSCLKRGMVYQSKMCPSFYIQRMGDINAGKRQQPANQNQNQNQKWKGRPPISVGEALLDAALQDSAIAAQPVEKVDAETVAKAEAGAEVVAPPSQREPPALPSSNASCKSPLIPERTDGCSFAAANATVPTTCPETGGNFRVGGPFWIAPIHDQDIVDELLRRVEGGEHPVDLPFPPATAPRIMGVLTTISEEIKDVPFYYNLPDLFSTVRSTTPVMNEVFAALINGGYRVSQFHHEPHAIKTDAPPDFVWDVVRSYCQLHPTVRSSHRQEGKAISAILCKEIKHKVEFTIPEVLFKPKRKIARFPLNPEMHWGPKRRAGRSTIVPQVGSSSEHLSPAATVVQGVKERDDSTMQPGDDSIDCDDEVAPLEKRFKGD